MAEGDILLATWLGQRRFAPTLARQLAARDALAAGQGPATLFLVEHPPTVTLGRRGRASDVLWDEARMRERGIEVCETPRGGEATLHAPGQLVVYPVIHVGRRIREHITNLAEATVTVLDELGIPSQFRMEHPGVWLQDDSKIASIGIHVSRGIAVQGLALNVAVVPDLFSALVSCGMPEVQMTSIAAQLGEAPSLEILAERWARVFSARCGLELHFDRDVAGEEPP